MHRRRLHILITAGPTREYLDAVRFLSNPSTGRMGMALARAARRAGHRVTLVCGPVDAAFPPSVHVVSVESAGRMLAAARRAFATADAAIFAAAVCDFRPARRAARKRPKAAVPRVLRLVPTADIAATLSRRKGRRVTVAFALEDDDGRRRAEEKLRRKRCDAIVLNGPAAVGADRVAVEFLEKKGSWKRWKPATKAAVARRIIQAVERLAASR